MDTLVKLPDGSFGFIAHGQIARFSCEADQVAVLPATLRNRVLRVFYEDELQRPSEEDVQRFTLTSDHVAGVCRSGNVCRFLALDPQGAVCLKGRGEGDLCSELDDRVLQGRMSATDENCDGRVGHAKLL